MFGTKPQPQLLERFDPAAVAEAAAERLSNGHARELGDLALATLASFRPGLGGELRQRAEVYAQIYRSLPAGTTDATPGLARCLEWAALLAEARVKLWRLRTAPVDPKAQRRALEERVQELARRRRRNFEDGDRTSLEAEAELLLAEEARNALRVAGAEIESFQRELDDSIRALPR